MSRSDAGSTSNASAAVGAPSEKRIWQHFHDVLDEEGQPILSNNRKSKVCNYCGHECKAMSLDSAVRHLDNCEEIPALGQEEDAVPLDVDRDDLFAKLTQGM